MHIDRRYDPAFPKYRTRDPLVRGARGAGGAPQWSIRHRRGADVVWFLLRTQEYIQMPLAFSYRCGLAQGSGVRLIGQNSLQQKTRLQVAANPEAQAVCEARQYPAAQRRKPD